MNEDLKAAVQQAAMEALQYQVVYVIEGVSGGCSYYRTSIHNQPGEMERVIHTVRITEGDDGRA